jgi:hypothetical protein
LANRHSPQATAVPSGEAAREAALSPEFAARVQSPARRHGGCLHGVQRLALERDWLLLLSSSLSSRLEREEEKRRPRPAEG